MSPLLEANVVTVFSRRRRVIAGVVVECRPGGGQSAEDGSQER